MLNFICKYKLLASVAIIMLLLISCANMGQGPQGGPRDWDSPKLVSASPHQNETNVKKNHIELVFSENIALKDQNEKVIVTPPQRRMPIIKHANKKVTIELRDTLLENTTYIIDFTDAIEDNNEGNPLENFSIAFSTGDAIDSLTISGKVIQAIDNEPVKGYYVGLHSNLEDTAFTHTVFQRNSRTNDRGEFTIKGVAPGKYHIFALNDMNRDYKYDNPLEAIAFYDVGLEPSTIEDVRYDTIYADAENKVLDTIKTVNYTRFIPDNILLRSFLSDRKREYFRNADRKEERQFTLIFGTSTQKPVLEPLNFEASDWVVEERNIERDSIYTYWITDEAVMKMDTLLFNMTYNMTDSLNQLVTKTDSLKVINRERKDRKPKKSKKDKEEEEREYLDVKSNIGAAWNIYEDITFEFNEPLLHKDSLSHFIKLERKVDTLFNTVDFNLEIDSLNPRKYTLSRKWNYGEDYSLEVDSAALYSLYGLWNKEVKQSFKVKAEDVYGKIAIMVMGVPDSLSTFIELLDASGKPARKAKVIDKGALFRNLDPGKYFVRLIVDNNNNFMWDTGDYETKRQPEAVYYYPSSFEMKANFEDILEFDVDMNSTAKPQEILKNKPVDKKEREEMLDAEEKKQRDKEREATRQQEDALDPARAARRRR